MQATHQSPGRRRAASPVLAAAVLLLLAGCSPRPDAAADPSRLVVAMSTFSEATFLPWNGSTGRKFYLDTIYEYLVYLDPETLEPRPGLAEHWEMSPDGREFRFRIRRGVAFQDGWGELTAADVAYTLDRIRDPEAIAGPSSPLRRIIDEVEVLGRYEVRVRLTAPDIGFVGGYLSNGLVVPIVCKRYVESVGDREANRHPVGTGAFELLEHEPDVAIRVRRRDDVDGHWRVDPAFEEIEFRLAPEEFTRTAMLKAGEADLAPVNYDSMRTLEADGLDIVFVRDNWAPVIRLGGLVGGRANGLEVPWQDVRVRRALNYAIDQQAIVDGVFHGHAKAVGADFPAPEWLGIEPYGYDPAKARRLLAEAGYEDGFPIRIKTFTTNPGAELPIIAEAVALYWGAVGLDVTIEPTSWTSLRGAWTAGKVDRLAWTHRGLPFSSTLAGLQASVLSNSLFASFANPETDARVDAVGAALDPAVREQRIRELGEYLRDHAAAVYIAIAHEPYGVSDKVGHWPALSQQGTNLDLISRPGHAARTPGAGNAEGR